MIRSSALLVVVAIALLAAGVFASSLELVYVSIGVSILAAVLLSAGVILRRREIFGTAEAARLGMPASRPAADIAAVPAMSDGRNGAARDDWNTGDRANGSRQAAAAAADASLARDSAAGLAGPVKDGTVQASPADSGPVKGGSVKGGSAKGGREAARRTGERSAGHAAGPGRPGSSPAEGREPAVAGAVSGADSELSWPKTTDREEATPGRSRDQAASRQDSDAAAPGRDRERATSWDDRTATAGRGGAPAGRDRDQAASREDREEAGARQGQDRPVPWQDRPAAAWDRGLAGPGRDQAASGFRPSARAT